MHLFRQSANLYGHLAFISCIYTKYYDALTLKVPSKICTSGQSKIFILQRKQVLIFHVNRLPEMSRLVFLWKKKKKKKIVVCFSCDWRFNMLILKFEQVHFTICC